MGLGPLSSWANPEPVERLGFQLRGLRIQHGAGHWPNRSEGIRTRSLPMTFLNRDSFRFRERGMGSFSGKWRNRAARLLACTKTQNARCLVRNSGRLDSDGGADRIRTCDPHNAIVVLYQLSYDPTAESGREFRNYRERVKGFSMISRQISSVNSVEKESLGLPVENHSCQAHHGLPRGTRSTLWPAVPRTSRSRQKSASERSSQGSDGSPRRTSRGA